MTSTTRLWQWFAIQTRLVQCFTVAILLHTAIVCILGTIRLATAISAPRREYKITGELVETPNTEIPASGTDNGSFGAQPGPRPDWSSRNTPVTLTGIIPPIGIEHHLGRLPDDGSTLVKYVPQPPSTSTGPIGYGTGLNSGSSGNPFYTGRFQPKTDGAPGTGRPTKQSEGAVLAALRWLRDHQTPDGSWKCPRNPPASSALAVLAFLAHGETADSSDFADTVNRGLGFLVRAVDANGFVPGKNMYAQAIVTLALCEGYALTLSPQLREPAERAAGILITAQTAPKKNPQHTGGWRYTSTSDDADTSVTGWTIMALQAAAHAGLAVPSAVFTNASAYLWRMRGQEGFGYAAPGDAPGTTAIATFCLQFLGHGEDARLKRALDLLKRQKVDWNQTAGPFVLYGWYYTTLAMFQGGGVYWESWQGQIIPQLIAAQADDGSWAPPPNSRGEAAFTSAPTYSTALGAMILETYYRYQPHYLQTKKAG